MKKIILSVATLSAALAQAQVGINQETPKATLDISVKTANKTTDSQEGLLIPRVTKEKALLMANNVTTQPEESALIYVNDMALTSSADTTVEDITEKGYYFWNGTKWVKSSSVNGEEWVYNPTTKEIVLKRSKQGDIQSKIWYDENGGYKNMDFGVKNEAYPEDDLKDYRFSNYNNIAKKASSLPALGADKTLNYSYFLVDKSTADTGKPLFYGSASSLKVPKDAVLEVPVRYAVGYGGYTSYASPVKATTIAGMYATAVAEKESNVGTLRGGSITANNRGTVDNIYGVYLPVTLSSASTTTLSIGNNVRLDAQGSSNTTTAVSTLDYLKVRAGATLGTLYGNKIETVDVDAGATITDFYGIYLEDVKGATNGNYAIYTGLGDIRFGQLKGTGERLVIANNEGVLSTSTASVDDFVSLWANDTSLGLVKLKNLSDGTPRTNTPGSRNDVTIDNDGKITAKAFIGYNGATIFPDYVFEKYYTGESTIKADYNFHNLASVESFIKTNGHLPGYQSAKEIASKGLIDLGATQLTNVEKIEELYLHTIEQEKAIKSQKEELKAKDAKIEKLENELQAQKANFENRLNKLEELLNK